jgi:hypothetical protein
MKQMERKAIALCDDAAVLFECSNNESCPVPRLTIHNAQYNEAGKVYPASSAVVFGESVRDLYKLLHEYYANAGGEGREV